ncbi:Tyrocidine synthase 3 [Enhygromyxa salina]|uniref:Tyrocidine synthase 3 n=1 Tax=Enhygromyxa salina TaxID=215803 RepID=A0A2S9XFK7_9BACT|nr:condensation domain-containing protein [Enhygromyxa salina]PRP91642.1 Tyrocidine synthase 3 [Enhygromyxa salina]
MDEPSTEHDIAIVGMAGRFPGAVDIDALWRNLSAGVNSIVPVSDEVLWAAGVPEEMLRDPAYVKVSAQFDDVELFDANFFGYTPAEAARMDPQARVFLELAWAAFEHAGLDPARSPGPVGVFAGSASNGYYVRHLVDNGIGLDSDYQVYYANQDDFLTTAIAYKLDLRGPAVTVQTFCSTALVATHMACQSILDGECDVALAGGVAISLPRRGGYLHWPGGISSSDGKVRPFDARADGTVFSSAAGAVVLMRLDDALRDGFLVHAVIRGTAINNDGALKAGYSSPSLEGQAAVIVEAMAAADVSPDSIGFVEAHGTGTNIGDPIEVAALTRAYRTQTARRGYCRLGSLKGNIGHANAAAGAAALIKATLALEREQIPPTINFERANPIIDLPSTPFVVNVEGEPWPRGSAPRRAGVSSLGFGGTNAHVILEEAPALEPARPSRAHVLLVVSARTEAALRTRCEQLAEHLERHPELELDDVGWTLQVGRRAMSYRAAIVVSSRAEAIEALRAGPRIVRCESRTSAPALPTELEARLRAVGEAWSAGAEFDWAELAGPGRRRVPLPSYPFERARYWIDTPIARRRQRRPLSEWFHRDAWRQARAPAGRGARWLVLGAEDQPGLVASLRAAGQACRIAGRVEALELDEGEGLLDLRGLDEFRPARVLEVGRALGRSPARVVFVTRSAVAISQSERLDPLARAALALSTVLSRERPELDVRVIDAVASRFAGAGALAAELAAGEEPRVALRGRQRWIPAPLELEPPQAAELAERSWWVIGASSVATRLARHLLERGCGVAVTGVELDGCASVELDLAQVQAAIGTPDGVVLADAPRGLATFAPLFEPGLAVTTELPEADDLAQLEQLAAIEQLARACPRRLVLSSLVGWVGGYGFGRSATASAFAEAWARDKGWASAALDVCAADLGREHQPAAIRVEEERELFDCLLALEPDEHVLVSTTELLGRLRHVEVRDRRLGSTSQLQPRPELDTPYLAPRDDEERMLARIWSELFELERVGVHDDFFELGGHSLLVTQLAVRVRVRAAIELSVVELFEHPTVAAQAERLRARASSEREGQLAERVANMQIPPRPADQPTPLSFSQQRLWFIDQLEGGTAVYNEPRTLLLDGPLDVAKLEAALTTLVARHEILRTSLGSRAGVAHQQVHPPWVVELDLDDVSAAPDPAQALAARVDAELERVFDLERAPLWRAVLVQLGPRRHALVRTHHHAITDGWSTEVFNRELFTLYAAACAGEPASLAPLTLQYGDYAAWQRRLFGAERARAELDYWREALADLPLEPVLSTDHPRAGGRQFVGGSLDFRYDPALTDAVQAFARREGATLFAVLLAAFGVLLGRLGDRRDVPIGTPVANRTRAELEGLVGLFVNTLVTRVRLDGAPTFRELVGRVSAMSVAAFAHQELPFEHVVDAVAPTRDLSRSALFQVMFVVHKPAVERFEVAGLEVSRVEPRRRPSRFDLSLIVEPTERGLKCRFDYAAELFEAATIEAYAEQLGVLLRAALAEPELEIDALPLLGEAGRERLAAWNPPTRASTGPLIHERVAALARVDPDRVALVDAERRWSYRELHEASNGLAWRLHDEQPGDRAPVAVLAVRAGATIVAMLAAFTAGRPFVPIDPKLPEARVRQLMTLAGADRLVEADASAAPRPDPPPPVADLSDVAYIIFTSGSTGTPKGVAVEHLQLCSYIDGAIERLALEPGRAHAVVSSLAADLGHTSIFAALSTGGTLHVFSLVEVTDPQAFAARMQGVDYLKIVPSHLAALLGPDPSAALPRRGLVIGGEAASVDWLRERVLPHASCRVDNHYGPTEATVGVLTHHIDRAASRIPLGLPLPGARVEVLDASGGPCGVGGVGEICVSGPQVARGYLASATSTGGFVPDPRDGGRMYRTGDRGRRRADGRIEFLGRIDDQTKIAGYRVEPGELRALLVAHPEVDDAAVIVRARGDGERQLLAYAVAPSASSDALIRYLEERLPPALVPRAVVLLERLPLTANGKLDRKALPEPEPEPRAAAVAGSARTELEARILAAWSEVLERPLAATDNFFAMGGDSFATLRVVARLQRDGLQVSARAIFRHQTVRSLAAALGPGTDAAVAPRPRAERQRLSPRQARIRAAGERPGERAAWNRLLVLEHIRGPLVPEDLGASLQVVVARHEALRTAFPDGEQRVETSARVPWTRARLRASADVLGSLAEPLAELLETPMTLDEAPLLRAALFELGDDEHVFALVGHELVTDVTSAGIIWHELCRIYAGEQLPPPRLHFLDALHWRNEQPGPSLARWREVLLPPPARLALPGAGSEPQDFRGHRARFSIPREASEALSARAQSLGVTRFAVLLATLASMVSAWTGQDDIVVGVPFTGRVHPSLAGVVGPLVNPLPIRLRVSADFDTLARASSAELYRAVSEEVAFEVLLAELDIEPEPSHSPLFQILLTHQGELPEHAHLPGCAGAPLFPAGYSARYDLTVALWEKNDETLGFVAGPCHRFTLQQLETTAHRLVETILAKCQAGIPNSTFT